MPRWLATPVSLLFWASCVALVLLCNHDRGIFAPIQGVPWVVLLVVGVLVVWTILLGRTKLGRYFYAIGGNAEAARRAGINVATIRIIVFGISGTMCVSVLVHMEQYCPIRLRSTS